MFLVTRSEAYARTGMGRSIPPRRRCRQDGSKEAVKVFARALEQSPRDARLALQLGAARYAAGDTAGGVRTVEDATRLDPYFQEAYSLLASWYREERKERERRRTIERYLRYVPQSLAFRKALAQDPLGGTKRFPLPNSQ